MLPFYISDHISALAVTLLTLLVVFSSVVLILEFYTMHLSLVLLFIVSFVEVIYSGHLDPTRLPTRCEVCKFLVTELGERLTDSGKSKEVLETGHGLETKKRRFKYHTSELRLTEALHEPHICEQILRYNVHAERGGSNRYAKGTSQTMQTIKNLVHKGVKVEMDVPQELWDEPSAEVSVMQKECFHMVEKYEEDIEDWYFNHQEDDLSDYLCSDRVLRKEDNECLKEKFVPKKESDDSDDEKPKKKKRKSKKNKKDERKFKSEQESDFDERSKGETKSKEEL